MLYHVNVEFYGLLTLLLRGYTELLCYYHLCMIAGKGNFGGKEMKGCSGRAVYQIVTEAV